MFVGSWPINHVRRARCLTVHVGALSLSMSCRVMYSEAPQQVLLSYLTLWRRVELQHLRLCLTFNRQLQYDFCVSHREPHRWRCVHCQLDELCLARVWTSTAPGCLHPVGHKAVSDDAQPTLWVWQRPLRTWMSASQHRVQDPFSLWLRTAHGTNLTHSSSQLRAFVNSGCCTPRHEGLIHSLNVFVGRLSLPVRSQSFWTEVSFMWSRGLVSSVSSLAYPIKMPSSPVSLSQFSLPTRTTPATSGLCVMMQNSTSQSTWFISLLATLLKSSAFGSKPLFFTTTRETVDRSHLCSRPQRLLPPSSVVVTQRSA